MKAGPCSIIVIVIDAAWRRGVVITAVRAASRGRNAACNEDIGHGSKHGVSWAEEEV